ncbi:hypothetical protein Droror1_Dr00009627 [Drosera rotundifolia]
MGASRKLQAEIDRVLKKVDEGLEIFDALLAKVYETDNPNQKEKYEGEAKKEIKKLQRYRDQIKTWMQSSEIKDKKISASYENDLLEHRKAIERAMERFKICERESKTKAFSKEGLGQQPKTDPKEKAKSETRDWINNVVGELELQIDSFEAEIEGLPVKKGMSRPPRLIHLETSIARHKAHIMKLEFILRLLDNDELGPEEVNDVRDLLDDYVERNQEDFDEFSEVDDTYENLPLVKGEGLEERVAIGQPSLVKGGGISSSIPMSKTSLPPSTPTLDEETSLESSVSVQEPTEQTVSQDTKLTAGPKTSPAKTNVVGSSDMSHPPGSGATTVPVIASTHESVASSASPAIPGSISGLASVVGGVSTSNISEAPKEGTMNIPAGRTSAVLADSGVSNINRTSQAAPNIPPNSGAIPSSGLTLGILPLGFEVTKRNVSGVDEKLVSSVAAGRVPSSTGHGVQWGPRSSLQSHTEMHGRPEIAPDQRENSLERHQQPQQQQQGRSNAPMMPTLGSVNQKQFPGQQNPLFPQLNPQSSILSSQAGLGIGVQVSNDNTSMPIPLQQPSIHQQAARQGSRINGSRDSDVGLTMAEVQLQQNLEDPATEAVPGTSLVKNLIDDDGTKTSFVKDVLSTVASSSFIEPTQLPRDSDLSPGLPLNPSQPSVSHGVIGRRSVADLGVIGDTVGGAMPNCREMHDKSYYLQMLETAIYKRPQPGDSLRVKPYISRRPASTPASYPKVQAPLIYNPTFWENLGKDPSKADILFFTFYFQQNTYQQYLAARELKKQSWRYHKGLNSWFQRQADPIEVTNEYEKGSYMYFDFHAKDELQLGWCRKLRHDYQFEYNYLEDEPIV